MKKENIKETKTAAEEKKAAKKATGKKATEKKDGTRRDDAKKRVEVVFILDRSGSMGGLEADTIGGFNSMLEKQKAESNEIIWSTVLFDHDIDVIHDRISVDEVQPLDGETYYARGTTALLDAVGGAIHHIGMVHKYAREEDRPDKTLFVITTDGMENASFRYGYSDVARMIRKEQERYGWEFIFLGANIDAEGVAANMGIDRRRAVRYHCDHKGVALNYSVVTEMTSDLAMKGCVNEARLDNIREDYAKRKKSK